MPEIAEVRTVAKTLNESLKNRNIIDIDIIYGKIIKTDENDFVDILKNNTFKEVSSYGKWLMFNMGEYTLLSHLRMEGKYFIKDTKDPLVKHEHIVFHLDNGKDLRYHDVRKFGVMILSKTEEVKELEEIKKLGIEPDSKQLTIVYLKSKLNKKKPIKELLLNQEIINGLGNIYVDEVLFQAKIHPETLGIKLNQEDIKRIIESSKEIIEKATKYKGTTIRSYTSSLGVKGEFQKFLKVHTKVGEKCQECGSLIIKTRVGGRGTYFCPKCQIRK